VTLSPMAIRQLRRLLGLLDIHLTSAIESNEVPGVALTGQEPGVRQDFRDRLKGAGMAQDFAREPAKILSWSGEIRPHEARKADGGESKSTKTHQAKP
jgi:hypothetical protein